MCVYKMVESWEGACRLHVFSCLFVKREVWVEYVESGDRQAGKRQFDDDGDDGRGRVEDGTREHKQTKKCAKEESTLEI